MINYERLDKINDRFSNLPKFETGPISVLYESLDNAIDALNAEQRGFSIWSETEFGQLCTATEQLLDLLENVNAEN